MLPVRGSLFQPYRKIAYHILMYQWKGLDQMLRQANVSNVRFIPSDGSKWRDVLCDGPWCLLWTMHSKPGILSFFALEMQISAYSPFSDKHVRESPSISRTRSEWQSGCSISSLEQWLRNPYWLIIWDFTYCLIKKGDHHPWTMSWEFSSQPVFQFHDRLGRAVDIDLHDLLIMVGYPLVNVHITMENHYAINGKTHYFNGHFQ